MDESPQSGLSLGALAGACGGRIPDGVVWGKEVLWALVRPVQLRPLLARTHGEDSFLALGLCVAELGRVLLRRPPHRSVASLRFALLTAEVVEQPLRGLQVLPMQGGTSLHENRPDIDGLAGRIEGFFDLSQGRQAFTAPMRGGNTRVVSSFGWRDRPSSPL